MLKNILSSNYNYNCRRVVYFLAFTCLGTLFYIFITNLIRHEKIVAMERHSFQANPTEKLHRLQQQQKDDADRKPSLHCDRLLSGDAAYIWKMKQKRIVMNRKVIKSLPMDCSSIRKRQQFVVENDVSEEERKFPLAFARIVYKDYQFLESEFATNFQPQNWYCFFIDAKADEQFRAKIHALSQCFPNVILPKEEYATYSSGQHIGLAYMECLHLLAEQNKTWEYAVVLNNHDVQIKTNQELVEIYKLLGGANDINYTFDPPGTQYYQKMIAALEMDYDWSFQALKLFKNDLLNLRKNANGKPLSLRFAKGSVQTSLSRKFVDFIVHQLDLSEFLKRLDTREYGADELIFQTLAASDDLNAPGGFTHKCMDQGIKVPFMTRFTIWYNKEQNYLKNLNYEKNSTVGPVCGDCLTCTYRHAICLLGMENLAQIANGNKYLFANKFLPSFDNGAILCWHQEMRRRRALGEMQLQQLDLEYYRDWPQTRFHREWLQGGGKIDVQKFNCK